MSILKSIAAWITGAAKTVKHALGFGHDVANWLKGLSENGTLDLIAAVTPWKWDDAGLPVFKEWLAELVYDMNIVDKAITTTDGILTEASKNISAMGNDARTIVLTGIAGAAAAWKNPDLPIQQAIAAAPTVYSDNTLVA